MSFFCTIDKSTAGTVFYRLARSTTTPSLPSFSTSSTSLSERYARPCRRSKVPHHDIDQLSSWFVTALVQAGQCNKHTLYHDRNTKSIYPTSIRNWHHLAWKPRKSPLYNNQRYIHGSALQKPQEDASNLESDDNVGADLQIHTTADRIEVDFSSNFFGNNELTKEEAQALVHQYDNYDDFYTSNDYFPSKKNQPHDTKEPRAPSLDYSVEYGIKLEDPGYTEWPEKPYVWPALGEAEKNRSRLVEAIDSMQTHPADIYDLYRRLPTPRIPYLHWTIRVKLMKRLGVLEVKDERSMLRYLSVLDDIKACGIIIPAWQFNIAMSYASAYVAKITDTQVRDSLKIWRDMEMNARVTSNAATFNILFTTAIKAGRIALAEKIYREMQQRGLEFNRYHYVSLIYYNALQGDGTGVRTAYKDLIDAGEIIDTVVLNCLISSFIKVGEPSSAEQVYEKMKEMHEKRLVQRFQPREYMSRRKINRTLLSMTKQAKETPALLEHYQNKSIIAPDAQTYAILVKHFAETAGEIDKTIRLLDEMHYYHVPLKGRIFLSIFKAFYRHGGIRYSRWTPERLQAVWTAFHDAVINHVDDVYISRWTVVYAIKAYAQVMGPRPAMTLWEDIQKIWQPVDDSEKDHVMGVVNDISERSRSPTPSAGNPFDTG